MAVERENRGDDGEPSRVFAACWRVANVPSTRRIFPFSRVLSFSPSLEDGRLLRASISFASRTIFAHDFSARFPIGSREAGREMSIDPLSEDTRDEIHGIQVWGVEETILMPLE